jgi:hypothetical protein
MRREWILISMAIAMSLALVVGLSRAQGPEPQGDISIHATLGTAFTYQGHLKKDGNPVNGSCDFQFSLWDAESGGTQVGSTQTETGVSVTEGLFTVPLNFGSGAFNGEARWLEIAVRCPAGSGSYTTLSPRQALTPAPYALALPGLWTQQNATSPNLIGGYSGNSVTSDVVGAAIGGGGKSGATNRVTDNYGTVGGGYGNRAGDDDEVTDDAAYATVGGGIGNTASGLEATIGGGYYNEASGWVATVGGGWTNVANATSATVAGGEDNTASAYADTVGGGYGNTASGGYATVAGGAENTASGGYATVGGGYYNHASGDSSTIAGGEDNTASGNYATVGGGDDNTASGDYATVPGGDYNTAQGDYSFAAGRQAKANHRGAFVWADSQAADFASTGDNQFLVRASGGMGVGTNSPATQLHVVKNVSGGASPENHVAFIENTSTGTSPDVLALKVNVEDPEGAVNFITFRDASGNIGAVEGNGAGGVTYKSGSGDFAEYLPWLDRGERPEGGEIVGLFAAGVSRETHGAWRVLVISTAPIVLGNRPPAGEESRYVPVALLGQVLVKVRGPVHVGDYIVPSGHNDGVGVAVAPQDLKASQISLVVGQALEDAAGEEVHQVKVLVGLPQTGILQTVLAERDSRIAALEARLRALEQGKVHPTQAGLLPGVGLFLIGLGLVWAVRRGGGGL